MDPPSENDLSQIVVFTLFHNDRDEKYGVEISQIKEIREVSSITPVPNSSNFLTGIMNLRGKIIPVIDTKAKLGLPNDKKNNKQLALIGEVDERFIGFLVDRVDEVTKASISSAENETLDFVKSSYVKGVAQSSDDFIVVIDLEKIFNEAEITSLQENSL